MENIKYPKAKVKLLGESGNAGAIMSRVTGALKSIGVSEVEINKYRKEATSGDYDHLLQVTMQWVTTDAEMDEDDFDNEWDEDDE